MGDNAFHAIARNYANSLVNLKHIIGRPWKDERNKELPGLQQDVQNLRRTFARRALALVRVGRPVTVDMHVMCHVVLHTFPNQ